MTRPDFQWMQAALTLARQGLGQTGANPSVGCIIVKDGRVLGRGRTGEGGRPHAEAVALEDVRSRWGDDEARGATAYVTLEPCGHHGLTPPCTDALIGAGVARVVAPISDPDPRVSGSGFTALRKAGMDVTTGVLADAASETLRGYLSRTERGRPFLTLKLAASLDGRIATRTGDSRWITGASARARVHLMRARSDGIMVGIGSVLADDPALDVRLAGVNREGPKRIVADSRLQTPLTGKLARSAREQDVILLCRDDADRSRMDAFRNVGATVQPVAVTSQGLLSMSHALETLAGYGIGSLLCEGGGRLAASLLDAGLVDELVWFSAGAIIGGGGAASIADFGVETIADMPRFAQIASERVGEDVMSVWHPQG